MLETLQSILVNYPVLAPFIFVIVRIIPIVFAPVPGLVLDFIGIAVFGWFYGFILAEIAVLIGTTIAFYIGRVFREPVVRRFTSLEKVYKWESKYSENQQFWGLVFMRALTSPVFDYLSYAAGLTNISFRKYILITFVASTPLAFSFYYFGSASIERGIGIAIAFFVIVFLVMQISQWRENKKNYGKDVF